MHQMLSSYENGLQEKYIAPLFHLKLIRTSVPMMTIRTVRMQG